MFNIIVLQTIAAKALKQKPVFVNGATEPLGQAIISLVLYMGCPVYTTVENLQKKEWLLRIFPQLNGKKFMKHFLFYILSNVGILTCNFKYFREKYKLCPY